MVVKRYCIALFVTAVYLLMSYGIGAEDAGQNPHVLVIHSYHQGYTWTDDLSAGIMRLLSHEYADPTLFYEYLDTIRHGNEATFSLNAELFRTKYHDIPLDGIIAADDAALDFLAQYYAELFPGVPVVFCGVGEYDSTVFADNSEYITGLKSSSNHFSATVELALSLHHDVNHVIVIDDEPPESAWYKSSIAELTGTYPSLSFEYVSGSYLTTDDMLAAVSSASDTSVAVLVTWQRDRAGRFFSIQESTELISEHAAIPLYGLGYHRLGYGIVGGMVNSGSIQGAAAARLLVDILHGAKPADIPVRALELEEYYFDYEQLQRWQIDEHDLPADSYILNRPFSFYHEYRYLVWGAGIVFLFLVVLVLILFSDIRLRRRLERRAVEQRNILVNVLSHIPHLVYWKNPNLEHMGCNRQYAEAAGFTDPEEVVGLRDPKLPWKRLISPRLESSEREVLATGTAIFDREETELTMHGEPAVFNTSIIPMRDKQGDITGILGIYTDVTERRRLEAQFIQAQKMETVGRLAGGVAHDFNNLLTVIIGNAEIALMEVDDTNPLHQEITEIQKTANRAAALTRQLLGFSRRQMMQLVIVDINEMILTLEKMLRRLIGEDIELVILQSQQLWPVYADIGQIEQVLTNLMVNARDAMPRGGTITIETENRRIEQTVDHLQERIPPGEYVMVKVSDTGEGMDEETLTKAFEPFFTTKEKGKGTGLGLSTCYGIVKQNRGYITIDSTPGSGTAITMYLPRTARQTGEIYQDHCNAEVTGGNETILLVEDEQSLNDMIKRILCEQGYRVLSALNGDEALLLLKQFGDGAVHLLITDVIMPRIGGRELVKRVHEFAPDMQVLYMSGYTDNTIITDNERADMIDFIQKPFSTTDFLNKVRFVIDKST